MDMQFTHMLTIFETFYVLNIVWLVLYFFIAYPKDQSFGQQIADQMIDP